MDNKQKAELLLSTKSNIINDFSNILGKFDQLSKKFLVEIDFASYREAAQNASPNELRVLFDKLETVLLDYCSADLFDIFMIDFDNFKATFNALKAGWITSINVEKSQLSADLKITNFTINLPTQDNKHIVKHDPDLLAKFDCLEQEIIIKDQQIKLQIAEMEELKMRIKLSETPANVDKQPSIGSPRKQRLTSEQLSEAFDRKTEEVENLRSVIEGLVENYVEDFELKDYLASDKLIEIVEHEIAEKSLEKLRFAFRCIYEIAQDSQVSSKVFTLKENLSFKNYFESMKLSVTLIKDDWQNERKQLDLLLAQNKEELVKLETKLKAAEEVKKPKISIVRRNTEEDLRSKLEKIEADYNKLQRKNTMSSNEDVLLKVKELEDDNSRLISQKVLLAQERDDMRTVAENLLESTDRSVDKRLVANMLCNYFSKKGGKKFQKGILESLADILDFAPDERIAVGLDACGQYVLSEGSTLQHTSRLPASKGLFKFG